MNDRDDEQAKRELAQDLRATLGAHRDLGADYDRELADSFVERVDGLITRRVADELAARQPQWPGQQWPGQWSGQWSGQWLGPGQVPHYVPVPYAPPPPPRRDEGYPVRLAVWSMLFGWLAALGLEGGGPASVIAIALVWCGIVAVNAVVALGARRRRPPG